MKQKTPFPAGAKKGAKKRGSSELNMREAILIRSLSEGKTFEAAAIDAGYPDACARHNGWRLFQSIKKKAPDIMDNMGLGQKQLIEKYLLPLLAAEEIKVFKANAPLVSSAHPDAEVMNGDTSDDGLIYSKPLPALGIRRDALEMAFKIHGAYAKTSDDEASKLAVSNHITVVIEDVSQEGAHGVSKSSTHTLTAETEAIQ